MYQYVKFSLMSGEMWCGAPPVCVKVYVAGLCASTYVHVFQFHLRLSESERENIFDKYIFDAFSLYDYCTHLIFFYIDVCFCKFN